MGCFQESKQIYYCIYVSAVRCLWALVLTLSPPSTVLSSTLSEMASVRAELLAYFTHILLGDALAAEYLILHLISNVYAHVFSP